LSHLFYTSQTLKRECAAKLAAVASSPDYPNLIRKLIVQGLIKIAEDEVEIQAKAEERHIVEAQVSHFLLFVLG